MIHRRTWSAGASPPSHGRFTVAPTNSGTCGRSYPPCSRRFDGCRSATTSRDSRRCSSCSGTAPDRVVYKLNAVLGLAEAIEGGIGIGHLPCFIGDARPGLVRLSAPQPDFAADLWLLTHADLRQSARVRVFLDFLAAEIGRHRSLIEGGRPASRQGVSAMQVELAPAQ